MHIQKQLYTAIAVCICMSQKPFRTSQALQHLKVYGTWKGTICSGLCNPNPALLGFLNCDKDHGQSSKDGVTKRREPSNMYFLQKHLHVMCPLEEQRRSEAVAFVSRFVFAEDAGFGPLRCRMWCRFWTDLRNCRVELSLVESYFILLLARVRRLSGSTQPSYLLSPMNSETSCSLFRVSLGERRAFSALVDEFVLELRALGFTSSASAF